MRQILFHADAFERYNDWATSDKKIFERVRRLIVDSTRDPFLGIGKPEPLKGELSGYWSRRISDEHRLVYRVERDKITIVSCKTHYKK